MAELHIHAMVRIGPQGRLVIPKEIRVLLGLQQGAVLLAFVEDGRLVLETREQVLDGLKARVRDVPAEVSLVDELIAERRAEAKREDVGP